MTGRTFTGGEREELLLRQGGKCAECGGDLGTDWEADHVVPFSLGGATELWNARALCQGCNRRKGATSTLRKWQADAIDAYFRHEGENFLLVATPGAGKTKVASEVADRLSVMGLQRIVVVVPTTYLKLQWANAFHLAGIPLTPAFLNRTGVITADYRGVVATYAQVSEAPDIFRRLVRERSTLVVLDEIHHCGDDKSWGDGIRIAFAPAARRLLLSGTPFRSDNNAIPFVRYVDGAGAADFNYGYGDALADSIVRAIYFPLKGSNARWVSGRGEVREASFDDVLEEREASERLRTVLQPEGDWFHGVIEEAHRHLGALRAEGRNAGGLVIASDQDHAQRIAREMTKLIGVAPVVAISDDKDASQAIADFATGTAPWIVAVKMVSEGIDIPRLRIGIYATNVRAELFFNQAIGRIIRRTTDEEDSAWFYLPADPVLSELARRIEETREHVLIELTQREVEQDAEGELLTSLFAPIASSFEDGGTVAGDVVLSDQELRVADLIRARAPQTAALPRETVALLLRNAGPLPAAPPAPPSPPMYLRVDRLRRINDKTARRIAARFGLEHREVNIELNRLVGVIGVAKMTEEQLERRLRYGEQWLARDE